MIANCSVFCSSYFFHMLPFLMHQGSNIISSFVKSPKSAALKESEHTMPLNIIVCEYADLSLEVYVVQHCLVNHHNISTTSESAIMQHTFQFKPEQEFIVNQIINNFHMGAGAQTFVGTGPQKPSAALTPCAIRVAQKMEQAKKDKRSTTDTKEGLISSFSW